MGAYHTLDLELNRKLMLEKPEWDSIDLERVDLACDVTQTADVAAVLMQDGLAHICLITPNMTIVRSKIDVAIPRKRKGFVQQHEKGLTKFYEAVIQGVLRHINFSVVKCVLIASPGFVKDQFFDYMVQQAIKMDNKTILDNRGKFLLVHSSSGFKHSLKGTGKGLLSQNDINLNIYRGSPGSRGAEQNERHEGDFGGEGAGGILHDAAM